VLPGVSRKAHREPMKWSVPADLLARNVSNGETLTRIVPGTAPKDLTPWIQTDAVNQGCTNPTRGVTVATKFCTVTPTACGSSVGNFMSPFWSLEF
jgi:hypothetical protein